MNFEPLATGQECLQRYVELFAACFPASRKFSTAYLQWLYHDNPSGRAIGHDAFDGERLAAHYAVIPVEVTFKRRRMLACWSLNTATHPSYQGKGLFTRLAERTYAAAAASGCVGVIGVANQNSIKGFIGKLGFSHYGQLRVRVGYRAQYGAAPEDSLRRIWDADSMEWRLRNPSQLYFRRTEGDKAGIYAVRGPTGTPVLLDFIDSTASRRQLERLPVLSRVQPTVMISYGIETFGLGVTLPNRLLPSPWNVIYRSLQAPERERPNLAMIAIDLDTF